MNPRAVMAIVRKDLQGVWRSKGVVLPLVLVPLVILGVMPALISLVPRLAPEGSLAFMDLERLPEKLQYPMLGVYHRFMPENRLIHSRQIRLEEPQAFQHSRQG